MRRCAVSASMVEFPNGVEYAVLLRPREMLVDGKADYFARMAIRHRKTPGRIAEMFQAFLLIERDRIVDFGFDPVVEAVPVELVPPPGEHHVEVIDVLHIFPARWHAQAGHTRKTDIVISGVLD